MVRTLRVITKKIKIMIVFLYRDLNSKNNTILGFYFLFSFRHCARPSKFRKNFKINLSEINISHVTHFTHDSTIT